MLKFIPTLTRLNWNLEDLDLSSYDEVLLTPNKFYRGFPKNYQGDIVIDNGGFLINALGRPKTLI